MTGVTNIFPDHTLEHINHINDLAFSASSTNKTVVPIQGSVPLVTFLSERPLEQLPFSRCGTSVPKKLWYSLYIRQSQDDSEEPKSPGSSRYQFCKLDSYDDYGNPLNTATNFQPEYYMKPYPFRNWKGTALDVLKHRIFVVVGGVHIKEVAKQPTLSSIACAPGNDAIIDLSKISASDATVTCTLKGADLDLVDEVSLQNSTDPNDKTQVQGKSSVHGDTTQADVTFDKKGLSTLKGTTYKLFYSLKGGGPQSTSLAITVKQVVGLSTTKLDFQSVTKLTKSAAKSVVVTNNGNDPLIFTADVTGTNKADFLPITTNTCVGNPVPAGKDCTISLTFTPSNPVAETASLSITYDGPGSPQTVDLTGTGK
jgi:Abnormal spindle-like microcephaly-assoc'd, ASPM-SPD-2-Hydin